MNVDLNPGEITDLVELLKRKRSQAQLTILNAEKSIKELTERIFALEDILGAARVTEKEIMTVHKSRPFFSPAWSWVRKIVFALEVSKRPLTTNEIIDYIFRLQPDLLENKTKVLSSVSATLSSYSPEYFIKHEVEGGQNKYTLNNGIDLEYFAKKERGGYRVVRADQSDHFEEESETDSKKELNITARVKSDLEKQSTLQRMIIEKAAEELAQNNRTLRERLKMSNQRRLGEDEK